MGVLRKAASASAMIVLVVAFAAQAQGLPPGTIACDMGGYSVDADPRGAPVRAQPSESAAILGRLAPSQKADVKVDEAEPVDEVWRTTFRILGFRDGWFLIDKGAHPFDTPDPAMAGRPRRTTGMTTYTGRGWLPARSVGGQYANGANLPQGWLYAAPAPTAQRLPAKTKLGAPVGPDGGPKRVLACRGPWAQVESFDGVTGWWNTLCSTQVTNCS